MKTKATFLVLLAGLFLMSFTPRTKNGYGVSNPSLKKKVEVLSLEMQAAFKQGNMLKVAGYYADDATILGPQGQKIQGRKAINEYWASLKDVKSFTIESGEVGGTSDVIYQLGKYTFVEEQNGQPVTRTADFVVLWKKQADWSYKIYMDSYN